MIKVKKVYVTFQKSFFDNTESPNQFYSILRKDNVGDTTAWIGVGSIASTGNDTYVTEISTLRDSTSQRFPENESILAYYPFNGNANDESGNGFNGELFGSISLTSDQQGNSASAFHFDGDDESSRIVISDNIPLANQSHTISLRIKPDPGAYDGNAHLFGHGVTIANNGLHSRFNGSENIQYAFWGNDISFDHPFPESNDWHHLVYTYDNMTNERKLYADGSLVGVNTASPYTGNGPFVIGGHVFDYGGSPWHGKIDDFIVWDVALSEDQVAEISDQLPSFTFGDDGLTEFKLIAFMNEGTFQSEVMTGYSVDNIAPGTPQSLTAAIVEDGINLIWDPSTDDDFQYFLIEKSIDDAFSLPVIYEVQESYYLDIEYEMNQSYFYRLLSVDNSGNQSSYSEIVETAVLTIQDDLIPEQFALHQNYPNPFNPTTQIRFDTAENVMVSIKVFDLMGREIKTLLNSDKTAGYHSIQWDATNSIGEGVSAGMYFYTIQAGEYRSTKKMVLLK
jgi:hypothetical protein